jgi:anti-sigma factor RsiW
MGLQTAGRPFDKHIDNGELDALVPSSSETGEQIKGLSSEAIRDAERHVESCEDCRRKVSQYRQLVHRFSDMVVSEAVPPGPDCPQNEDVDWHEVAAGLWPELQARQLIMHAALCDHCGPLLRAATSVNDDPTPQEEELLAQLKTPSRPVVEPRLEPIRSSPWSPPIWRQFLQWRIFVPVVALMVIVGLVSTRRSSTPTPLSGPTFAEFAVRTHRQHAEGSLALDVRSNSQQTINEWFKARLPFSLVLPASPPVPGEERPYRVEGARLVRVRGKSAAFIAYQLQTAQLHTVGASLMVTPDTVAVASDGVKVDYRKVSFHYATVEGYRVVTWSLHGLTYALVSQEGNGTQRSCMVCHSAMRDRDLSQTPTPLRTEPVLQ